MTVMGFEPSQKHTAMKSMPCSSQLEKAHALQWRLNTDKNKQINFKKGKWA